MLKDGTWNFSQKLIGFACGLFPICELQLSSFGIGIPSDHKKLWNFLFPIITQGVKIVISDKWFWEPALLCGEFRDREEALFFVEWSPLSDMRLLSDTSN